MYLKAIYGYFFKWAGADVFKGYLRVMPKLEKIEFFDVRLPVKFLPRSNCYGFIYQLISPSGKVYIGQTQRE